MVDTKDFSKGLEELADIVIVGAGIVKAADVETAARAVREAIDSPAAAKPKTKTVDDEIREILNEVKGVAYRDLCDILKEIDRDLVKDYT